ncbi:MAG: hypothetical protein ACLFQV_13435 [Vulcanimicrobiota bacterium]
MSDIAFKAKDFIVVLEENLTTIDGHLEYCKNQLSVSKAKMKETWVYIGHALDDDWGMDVSKEGMLIETRLKESVALLKSIWQAKEKSRKLMTETRNQLKENENLFQTSDLFVQTLEIMKTETDKVCREMNLLENLLKKIERSVNKKYQLAQKIKNDDEYTDVSMEPAELKKEGEIINAVMKQACDIIKKSQVFIYQAVTALREVYKKTQ